MIRKSHKRKSRKGRPHIVRASHVKGRARKAVSHLVAERRAKKAVRTKKAEGLVG